MRWKLFDDGFEVLSDSERSYKSAAASAKEHDLKALEYQIKPISLRDANVFVEREHRHHKKVQGHKFSLSLQVDGEIVGVIIGGRPVSRHQDDGLTLEVTRCCVRDHYKNGVTKLLYSSLVRVASAMGYERVITYTLEEEDGSSMLASNFQMKGKSSGGSWNSSSRTRIDKHPVGKKSIWEKRLVETIKT